MRRFARVVVVTVLGLFLVYLLCVNALLMTSLGQSLASSERADVRWKFGWSVVPTRVHLRGLAIDELHSSVRWHIEADRVTARIAALPLLRRRLEIPSAELAGVTVRGREADDSERWSRSLRPPSSENSKREKTAQRKNGPPPMALVDHTTGDDERAPDASGDGRSRAWSMLIRKLEATDVREVTVRSVSLRSRDRERAPRAAPMAARGSFDIDPRNRRHAVRVHDLSLALEGADLFVHERKLLANTKGNITLVSSSHEGVGAEEESASRGRPWLSTSGGGAELTADVVGLPRLLENRVALSWPDAARGTLRTSLRIEKGGLAPGSTAVLRVPPEVVRNAVDGNRDDDGVRDDDKDRDRTTTTPFSLAAVLTVASDGKTTLSANAGGATLSLVRRPEGGGGRDDKVDDEHQQQESAMVTMTMLRARIFSPRLLLADPFADATGTVRMTRARINPRAVPLLSTITAASVPRTADHDGDDHHHQRQQQQQPATIEGDADLVLADGTLSGHIEAATTTTTTSSSPVVLQLGDVALEGPLHADVVLRSWHLGSGRANLDASISHGGRRREADEASAAPPASMTTTPMSSSLTLTNALVQGSRRERGATAISLDANARFAMSDTRIALDALTGRAELPSLVWAVAATQPLSGTMNVHVDDEHIALRDIDASAGFVRVQGEYTAGTAINHSGGGGGSDGGSDKSNNRGDDSQTNVNSVNDDGRSSRDATEATLLVEAGPLATGVSVGDGATTLIFINARDWFEQARRQQTEVSGK